MKFRNLEEAAAKSGSDSSLHKLLKRASILSWLIAFIIIISWFIKPTVYSYIAGIISIIIASVLWIYELIYLIKRRGLSNQLSGILFNLSEKGIKVNNAKDAMAALGKFSEDYERTQINFRRYESDLITSERHLREIGEKIAEYREIIDKNEKNILSIK